MIKEIQNAEELGYDPVPCVFIFRLYKNYNKKRIPTKSIRFSFYFID